MQLAALKKMEGRAVCYNLYKLAGEIQDERVNFGRKHPCNFTEEEIKDC